MFYSCLYMFLSGIAAGLVVLCGLLAIGVCLGGARLNAGDERRIEQTEWQEHVRPS